MVSSFRVRLFGRRGKRRRSATVDPGRSRLLPRAAGTRGAGTASPCVGSFDVEGRAGCALRLTGHPMTQTLPTRTVFATNSSVGP